MSGQPAELLGKTNQALPLMMKRLLPPGLLGLNLAATVAACMSSLDSVFTAAASLFCLDVYKQYLRPHASEAELVRAGRWFCLLLATLTVLWLPVIELLSEQVFVYIQSISMYLAPPIVCVYFLGVLWPRSNAHGATAAFAVGYALGLGRMVGEIVAKVAPPPPGSLLRALLLSNYLYAGTCLFLVCVLTHVLVSLATPPPAQMQLHGLALRPGWPRRALRRCCGGLLARRPRVQVGGEASLPRLAEGAAVELCSAQAAPQGRREARGRLPMLSGTGDGGIGRDVTFSVSVDGTDGGGGARTGEVADAAAGGAGAAGGGGGGGGSGDGVSGSAPSAEATQRAVHGVRSVGSTAEVQRCSDAAARHFHQVTVALSTGLVVAVIALVAAWF